MALVQNCSRDSNEDGTRHDLPGADSGPFFLAARLSTSGCTFPCHGGWSGERVCTVGPWVGLPASPDNRTALGEESGSCGMAGANPAPFLSQLQPVSGAEQPRAEGRAGGGSPSLGPSSGAGRLSALRPFPGISR